jgi:hypothetical protein
MKRLISAFLAFVLLLSSVSVLAACGTNDEDTAPEYISEDMRLEHIAKLEEGGVVIAENVKTVHHDEENDVDIVEYTWTVDPAYATPVGKTVSNYSYDDAEGNSVSVKQGITNMSLIMENDKFEFYMDLNPGKIDITVAGGSATDFAVKDKETGHVYHSNSNYEANSTYANVKAPSKDIKGTPDMDVLNPIVSNIALEAYDVANKRYEFNFRENCLEDLRIQVVKMADNKLRVIYTIGNDPDKDLVPPVITVETYEWITARLAEHTELNEKGTKTMGDEKMNDIITNYKFVTPENLDLEDRERLIKNYPLLDAIPMYIVRVLNTRQKKLVKEAMQLAGFTVDMLKREMELVEYSGPERAVMFTIPVDYTLTNEGLTVNIDSTLIQAPSKQKMYKIQLLRAFGSMVNVSKQTNTPYIITCDGSGAFMPANGYVTQSVYTARIYGEDNTFQNETQTTKMMQIVSPYLIYDRSDFGGIMEILEGGTAQAFATARPSNSTNNPGASINYDLVYSERDYRTYSGGQSSSSSSAFAGNDNSSSGVVLSKEKQVANFQVSYYFTPGNMTYSEYAEMYRNYLIDKGVLPSDTIAKGTKTPFYLEAIGAINKNESVGGLPVDATKALTSYTELKEIVENLVKAGVANINVRYLYWSNEGYYNTIANIPALMSEMGSRSELNDLVSYMKSNNVGFYPSADFLYVYKDKLTDALNYTNDAARRLDMRVARVRKRVLSTGRTEADATYTQTILNPMIIPSLAKSYKAEFEKIIDNKQIALGEIGKDLNSNYRIGHIVNRTQALDAQIEALETFYNDGYKILVSTGNDYTWKYADHIVNLPIGGSEYLSSTGSIPFIPMVLHGYIQYAAAPFNISADYETQFLKCLETGSGVNFRWMYDENSVFDNTRFYDFYSLHYTDSFDRAVELYKEVASVLDKVSSERITLHETAVAYIKGVTGPDGEKVETNNVFHVIYGDGALELYVNYNSFDVEVESGATVPALGYLEVK